MSARVLTGDEGVKQACLALRRGEPVAIPTETVYGLAADALNPAALERIFVAKGRPTSNPLILHVSSAEMAERFVRHFDARARKLAERFWPGPLTLVLEKNDLVPDIVTAGGPTVALRAPQHPVAREIIEGFGGPLAAPSANRSTGISPTTAEAVMDELGDRISLIIDGGACEVGLESTVLDLSVNPPVILRPGHVGREMIEAVLGEKLGGKRLGADDEVAKSPGQSTRHYSPRTPVRLVEHLANERSVERAVFLLRSLAVPAGCAGRRLPETPELYARALYAALRWADAQGASEIIIERPPREEAWSAIEDRLRRAAGRDEG